MLVEKVGAGAGGIWLVLLFMRMHMCKDVCLRARLSDSVYAHMCANACSLSVSLQLVAQYSVLEGK